jgi:signal peptidase I
MMPSLRLACRLLPLAALLALLGAGCWSGRDHKAYLMPSSGMEPTIHCAQPAPGCHSHADDRIIVDTSVDALQRGDIVAFHTPRRALQACGAEGVYVKRVVGLPGETVSERSGFVYVDGKKLHEPYVGPGRSEDGPGGRWHVPKATYFVLGDNRAFSCDSRRWGSVPRANVIGRVVKIAHRG